MSGLLPDDWKVVKALGDIVLDRIHSGMKVFPSSLVATALLQKPSGLKLGMYNYIKWLALAVILNSLALCR